MAETSATNHITIRRGQPQFAAWMRHWEATRSPMVRVATVAGAAMVETEWPPRSTGAVSGQTDAITGDR